VVDVCRRRIFTKAPKKFPHNESAIKPLRNCNRDRYKEPQLRFTKPQTGLYAIVRYAPAVRCRYASCRLPVAIVTPILKKPNLDRDDPANYRPISNLNNVSSRMYVLLTTLALFSLHIGYIAQLKQLCIYIQWILSLGHLIKVSHLFWCHSTWVPLLTLSYSWSYRFPTGLSFGSNPLLVLYIPNQTHCRCIWRRHTTVCWRCTIIRIAHYDRYACTTVATLRLPVCFAQLVLSQWPALNSSKSESILIGTRQRLRTFPHVAFLSHFQKPSKRSESLDQNLTLNKQVSSLSRGINFYTRALRHIRPALSESMAANLGASLVQSRLDYANSIMYGMSASKCTNYSLPRILLRVWFCLLFAIFQQVTDLVTPLASCSLPNTVQNRYRIVDYVPCSLLTTVLRAVDNECRSKIHRIVDALLNMSVKFHQFLSSSKKVVHKRLTLTLILMIMTMSI